jgi:predicted membrane GTPase involved in stress response
MKQELSKREAAGMRLPELHSYIQEHQPNICQISVLRDGNEIYSAEWNGYQRTDEVDSKEFLTELFEAMYNELPLPKQKRKNNGMR